MLHLETHVVKAEDERPYRPDGTCFYCYQQIGENHKPDCVLRKRSVICELKVMLVRLVPESWTSVSIDFHMNDSSWCANNLVKEMQSIIEQGDHCLCLQVEGRFVREATAMDEMELGVTE